MASEDGLPCPGPGEVEVTVELPATLSGPREDAGSLPLSTSLVPTVRVPALMCLRHAQPLLGCAAGPLPCLRVAGMRVL